jgi:hypothetical protein
MIVLATALTRFTPALLSLSPKPHHVRRKSTQSTTPLLSKHPLAGRFKGLPLSEILDRRKHRNNYLGFLATINLTPAHVKNTEYETQTPMEDGHRGLRK